jgi:hypothetical protein
MKKVHKVSGVYIPKNGHKGCVQSHIIALNMIKMNKWDRVLILEDDAQLDVSPEIFNKLLDETLDYLDTSKSNWNVINICDSGSSSLRIDRIYNLAVSHFLTNLWQDFAFLFNVKRCIISQTKQF